MHNFMNISYSIANMFHNLSHKSSAASPNYAEKKAKQQASAE